MLEAYLFKVLRSVVFGVSVIFIEGVSTHRGLAQGVPGLPSRFLVVPPGYVHMSSLPSVSV